MNVIVLTKYVADIERVPADAWDRETGTLQRSRLEMVANPLDDHALAVARRLRGEADRIVVVSMGPASAEFVCRRGLAYGADAAFLVTDKAFAGSDTLATARVLGQTVRTLSKSLDLGEPLILCGMQSPDGDTAQVPAELAATLDLPFIPYVTSVGVEDEVIHSIAMERDGTRGITVRGSAVLACTGFADALPFYTTFERLAFAHDATVPHLGLSDLGISADEAGMKGSATRVVRIETVAKRGGAGQRLQLGDTVSRDAVLSSVVRRLGEACRPGEARSEQIESVATSERKAESSERYAEKLCMSLVELDGTGPTAGSLELVGETRRLADEMHAEAAALLVGDSVSDSTVETLAEAGATRVVCVTTSSAGSARDYHSRATLLCHAISHLKPFFILVPASLQGRTVAPLAAGQSGLGLTADCTSLAVEKDEGDPSRSAWKLYQTRPALGGNILATIVSSTSPELATVRAGVFPRRTFAKFLPDVQRLVFDVSPREELSFSSIARTETAAAGVDTGADIVVAVGVGIGTREKLDQYVRPLMDALANRFGLEVTLACSRGAVDADILPYPYQVGQTGKTVRPALYIAIGISGAIQHRLGMEHAATICSINPDPEADIHDISQIAIVAPLEEALPQLTAALRRG